MSENNIVAVKANGRIRRIISKILNFFCALVIFSVILFAIGAFIQADVQSKNILGNHDYQIFSYGRADDGTTVFKAFGESITVDFNKLYMLKTRFDEVSAINKDYAPSIIVFGGDIINGCISSVGESFMKIPDIIEYFYDKLK